MKYYLRQNLFFIFLDILFVAAAFVIMVIIKPGGTPSYFLKYFNAFFLFLGIWLLFTLSFRKFDFATNPSFFSITKAIILCNVLILLTITFLMYLFRTVYFSRFIVFGTIGITTLLELLSGGMFSFFIKPETRLDVPGLDYPFLSEGFSSVNTRAYSKVIHSPARKNGSPDKFTKEIIHQKAGNEVFNFCDDLADLSNRKKTLLIDTSSAFNIESAHRNSYSTIINFKKINDTPHIDSLFKAVNTKLENGGIFIGCVETKNQRKVRILRKYPWGFNFLYYYFIDFPVKRVFPKFELTRWIFYILTRGQNRVISRAEALGRLSSAGFIVAGEKFTPEMFFFAGIKTGSPILNGYNPSYGLFIRLARVGKDGKEIRVIKFRTMHPYAEFLQDYIYEHHHLEEGGKFKNDFRISTQGKLMRKIWVDELPMLLNWIKGDLKMVGVRPLSKHYFNLYAEDLKKKRIKYKPGLIPPFYADMPKTLEEIQRSERNYLISYEKSPFRTDWVYFWKAVYNILFRKARSR
ncbi:MAG: hypothetical protein GXO83_03835 [Chlorobi bacterium]|nr:hypothetical protein [Chlorobiota bacterium]